MSRPTISQRGATQVSNWLNTPSLPVNPQPKPEPPAAIDLQNLPQPEFAAPVVQEQQESPAPPLTAEMAENFDDIADDAAATAFQDAFSNLLMCTGGTEEDIDETIEDLFETLNDCVTQKATVDEMVSSVFDTAAAGKYAHYTASVFLAKLSTRLTKKVEGYTLSDSLTNHLRSSLEESENALRQLMKELDHDPGVMTKARNAILFATELSQKLMRLPHFRSKVPAMMYSVTMIINLCFDTRSAMRSEYVDNCACAVQILRIIGATFDEMIRTDPSVVKRYKEIAESLKYSGDGLGGKNDCAKFEHLIPGVYNTLRSMLISSMELSPFVRADIVKVLEFRASRWGEVPPPDQPMYAAADETVGRDEVDVTQVLSQEELDFFDKAVDELEFDDRMYDGGVKAGGGMMYTEDEKVTGESPDWYEQSGQQEYEQDYRDLPAQPETGFVYRRDDVPSEALEAFRQKLNKPDGAGDRSTGTN